ncbi:MAG TPA: SDR family oxidoreductase, partial [Pseudonocardiaceae bacterium]|nr:SDR family oxidoreductase [Pseudonocardiaceae bacterium]
PDFVGREVFITGAGSGIGRAVAEQAGGEGARVHLVDRNEEALLSTVRDLEAQGVGVGLVEALDVSDYEAVRAVAAKLTAEYGAMDVVMNIAGIASWGTIQAMPHETWQRLVDVNLMGPIHIMEELVPPMIEAGRGGQLVNCSSAAGIIAMPWHAAYSATKFGLRGVSEVLRYDLARYRIGVSLVCPGGVDTGLVQTIEIAGVDATSPRFLKARKAFQRRAVTPDEAATAILKGVRRNRYWVYTSPDIHAVHLLQRYLPPGYAALMHAFNLAANRVLPEVQRARRPEGGAKP